LARPARRVNPPRATIAVVQKVIMSPRENLFGVLMKGE
jgi:hypothetical protein